MPNLSYGTYLQINGGAAVAGLQEIQGLEVKANTVDVTNLASTAMYKEFMAGFKEVSDLTVSGFFQPDDTDGQIAMWGLLGNGAKTVFAVVFPFGASWSFNAIVTGFKTGAKTEDGVSFDATLKVSGAPTLNLTASGGLTDLATTAGTLSPAFSGSVYEYTVTATTSSVTVTPTGTGTLTVNGASVTSGSASAAIAVASGNTTNIVVTQQESGKVPVKYILHVSHA